MQQIRKQKSKQKPVEDPPLNQSQILGRARNPKEAKRRILKTQSKLILQCSQKRQREKQMMKTEGQVRIETLMQQSTMQMGMPSTMISRLILLQGWRMKNRLRVMRQLKTGNWSLSSTTSRMKKSKYANMVSKTLILRLNMYSGIRLPPALRGALFSFFCVYMLPIESTFDPVPLSWFPRESQIWLLTKLENWASTGLRSSWVLLRLWSSPRARNWSSNF